MKRFRYRFDSILKVREMARDEARLKVADALKALAILDERVQSLKSEQTELKTQIFQNLTGAISVDNLLEQGRYDLQIDLQRRELETQKLQIEQEVERRRGRLALAEQECRKFERLKEIAQENYTRQEWERLQAELDELGSQRHHRMLRELE